MRIKIELHCPRRNDIGEIGGARAITAVEASTPKLALLDPGYCIICWLRLTYLVPADGNLGQSWSADPFLAAAPAQRSVAPLETAQLIKNGYG